MTEEKRYEFDLHLSLELAGTYYFMGETARHAEVIGWFFDGTRFLQPDDATHTNLMKSLKYFDPDLSGQVVECFFRTYFPFTPDSGSYKTHVLLETIEELGQHGLVSCVKQLVDRMLEQVKKGDQEFRFELERPMRTLASLVLPADEEWLLARLDDLTRVEVLEFPQLRRAAECLGYCGSVKALPYLRRIALQCKKNPTVLNACQMAYERIGYREKIAFPPGDLLQEGIVPD
jgi:hypothetical protein